MTFWYHGDLDQSQGHSLENRKISLENFFTISQTLFEYFSSVITGYDTWPKGSPQRDLKNDVTFGDLDL